MSAGRVIETRSLRKEFGRNVAVADLSLGVGRGEVFGFLGPNGAGKTTSLKLLLGLIEPTGGRGELLGAPLGNRAARASVGFLPEHFRFHDCLSARELLRMHGRLFGLGGRELGRRIEALLERVDLTEAADRPVRTYSKGMLQRTGLAQALINRPVLVFLDEPTSGLDPLGRLLVRDIIEELREGGTSVFLNSHLLGEVEATCDRVAFVKAGRILQELSLRDGAAGVVSDVELRVDRAGPEVVAGLARFGSDVSAEGKRLRLRVESEERLPEIARWLVDQGVGLYEMHSRVKTLEERFVEIMGDDQRPG